MKKLFLTVLLSFFALTSHSIETKNDPLSEFSEETLSTYNDVTNSIVNDLEGLEDDIISNDTDIATNVTDITTINALIATTATANKIYQSGADTYLPDSTVDTTALKTASGEVNSVGDLGQNLTLPGGEYGFWPQVKASDTTSVNMITIVEQEPITTSYATIIHLNAAGGQTVYAQQRYMTASGYDLWVFLIIDKITKEIVGAYQAPDAPWYGNSGDQEKVPHPFGSYDETKHEIILLDKITANQIKQEAKDVDKSILSLINEDKKVDVSKEMKYIPLHSGKFLGQKPELVKSVVPYIKIRTLKNLTQAEKDTREMLRETHRIVNEQKKEEKKQNRIKGIDKLKTLGLKEAEIEALFN